ncbi:MAG TPA: hypothetical protein DCQ33_07340 [Nitrospira sp.]|nr:hypothetical protein [Nitrospira sp.]
MNLKLADLEKLSPKQRQDRLSELARASQRPVNGEVKVLDQEILAYERKYSMDSETLKRRLSDGTFVESDEVCLWLMRLKLRDRLVELRARPH